MNLNNAVVILTGASAGIGAATARQLAAAGARLVITARRKALLESLAESLREDGAEVLVVAGDLTDPEQVQALVDRSVQRFGRVDVLVNNAGVAAICPVEKMQTETYQRLFELNVLAPLRLIQQVIPVMRSQGGGLLLNVSSMVSRVIWPSMGAYASTKFALNCLSETLRLELADDNIRVSVVFPDNTATDFGSNALLSIDPPTAVPGGGEWQVDSPDYVARKICEAMSSEPAELYVRES